MPVDRALPTFLLASLLVGVPMVFVTPPFQAPDEPAHFLRAFALSEGRLLSNNTGEGTGSRLPTSLRRLFELSMADVTFQPDRRFEAARLRTALAIRLEAADRAFESYPTSSVYTPLSYLPQALGIAVARTVADRPLLLFYSGRLVSFGLVTALVYLALLKLPALRWFGCVLAMAPMALFLRASLSADALCFALALLVATTVARLVLAPASSTDRHDRYLPSRSPLPRPTAPAPRSTAHRS
jgi:uncharacterized membrane protein